MRVALLSPYSYTYPGGVIRHVEALAQELIARGDEVRLLAPHDPDDRLARIGHRGARPGARLALTASRPMIRPAGRAMLFSSPQSLRRLGARPAPAGLSDF